MRASATPWRAPGRRFAPWAAALGVALTGATAWPFTVDDAYLVARVASNLAHGGGWAMNAGVPVDAVTGPLWALPLAAASAGGVAPVPVAKALGLLCAALAAFAVTTRAGGHAGGRVRAWLCAALVACGPTLGVWGQAGLETGAATLCFTLAVLSVDRRRPWVLGACVAVLAWLRPDTAGACVVLLAAVGLRDRRGAALALGLGVFGAAGVIAFRLACFGAPLPLALDAKPGLPFYGVRYVLVGLCAVSGIGGVFLMYTSARYGGRAQRALALAVLAQALSVAAAGGDWMPGYRLLAPALPCLAFLCADGASALLRHKRFGLALAALGLACGVPLLDAVANVPEARAQGAYRDGPGAELAHALRAHHTVALVDCGYLAYTAGFEVVDLGGLTDTRIARSPGGHLEKQIDPGYLAARAPDAIVLHTATVPRIGDDGTLLSFGGYPVEQHVAAMPWVRAHFTVDRVSPYAPGYGYIVLVRR